MKPVKLPIKEKNIYYLLPGYSPQYTDFTYISQLGSISPHVVSKYVQEFYDPVMRSYRIDPVIKIYNSQPKAVLTELVITALQSQGLVVGEPINLIEFVYQKPLTWEEIKEKEKEWWNNKKKYISRSTLQTGFILQK